MPHRTGKLICIFSFIRNRGMKARIVVLCILFSVFGISQFLIFVVQRIKVKKQRSIYLCKKTVLMFILKTVTSNYDSILELLMLCTTLPTFYLFFQNLCSFFVNMFGFFKFSCWSCSLMLHFTQFVKIFVARNSITSCFVCNKF